MADIPIIQSNTANAQTELLEEIAENTSGLQKTFLKNIKENKKEKEEDKKEEKVITKGSKLKETFFGSSIDRILKPFSPLTGIIEEFTGFNLSKSLKNVFKAKPKLVPTKRDLSKTDAGQAELYRQNQMKKKGKEKDKDKKGGFFGGRIGGTLLKALPIAGAIAAIAGGLIWATVDAIKASVMSGKWGVTKTSAVIGGFLAGTGSGWKNAFKNAGKWALIGAGTGFLIGGPIGAIVGGLIGAVVGGLIGYFGGEKMAKGIQAVTDFMDNKVETQFEKNKPLLASSLKSFLRLISPINMIESGIKIVKTIADKEIPTTKKISMILTEGFHMSTFGIFKEGGIFRKLLDKGIKKAKSKLEVTDIGKGIIDRAKKLLKILSDPLGAIIDLDPLSKIQELDPIGKVVEFVGTIKENIFGVLNYIGDFFSFIKTSIDEKGLLKFSSAVVTGKFGEEFGEFRKAKDLERGMEDGSIGQMNKDLKEANDKKRLMDEQMLEELKKISEKKETGTSNVQQNNYSNVTFNPNTYRTNLMYKKNK